jgi:hypothetical protein
MTYSAIDGDISDFFDAQVDPRSVFRLDELRAYLLNAGHADLEARAAVLKWQEDRFRRVNGTWEKFALTPAGLEVVAMLRARAASPSEPEAEAGTT